MFNAKFCLALAPLHFFFFFFPLVLVVQPLVQLRLPYEYILLGLLLFMLKGGWGGGYSLQV